MPQPQPVLAGRRALVTGSSRGVGLALARALAEAGAEVLLNGRDLMALGDVAADLAGTGARVQAVGFDLESPDSRAEALAYCLDLPGGVDILVNAAGAGRRGSPQRLTPERLDAALGLAVIAALDLAQTLAGPMAERGYGRILNILPPGDGVPGAALAALTGQLAAEWGPRGLTVNALAPPRGESPGADFSGYGPPAVLLASAAGGRINGKVIHVDDAPFP